MRKRGLGRKGAIMHEFYMILAQLFLIGLIAVALTTFVTNRAEGITFDQDYYSKDLALLLNTIYAAPGDLTYNYPANFPDYYILVGDNVIQIGSMRYAYFSDRNFEDLNFESIGIDKLTFIKTKNKIIIEENE